MMPSGSWKSPCPERSDPERSDLGVSAQLTYVQLMCTLQYIRSIATAVVFFAAISIGCETLGSSGGGPGVTGNPGAAGIDRPTLKLGEFDLEPKSVIDGDTLRIPSLPKTLRLIGVDTEETFKLESDAREAEADWPGYVARHLQSGKPEKFATPMGEKAKAFAQDFFAGAKSVRLERDRENQIRDRYGRYLVYVFVKHDGKWLNYNVECVRAGMSPYFMKYGYSNRFHVEFEAVMTEARAAHRGIWNKDEQRYPDYDVRLDWWRARAEIVRGFDNEAVGKSHFIALNDSDALERLTKHVGKAVELLGGVAKIVDYGNGPIRVYLSHRDRQDFPLIFFDRDLFQSLDLESFISESVRVRGKVEIYKHPRKGDEQLQIVINSTDQLSLPQAWPPPTAK